MSALVSAIYEKGPISVAIDASHKSLSFYSHGVYYEPQCGKFVVVKYIHLLSCLKQHQGRIDNLSRSIQQPSHTW